MAPLDYGDIQHQLLQVSYVIIQYINVTFLLNVLAVYSVCMPHVRYYMSFCFKRPNKFLMSCNSEFLVYFYKPDLNFR